MAPASAKSLKRTDSRRFGYYELPIFLFFLFEFFLLNSGSVMDLNALPSYVITYEFGFTSKALIGSVFSLFTERVTPRQIYTVSILVFLILVTLISYVLGAIIRKSSDDTRPMSLLFVLLFISSPFSITYLLGMYIGRFDAYWIILTLVALAFIKRPVLRWGIPFLCAVAMSVHHGYMFAYMPALAIPLLYEVYRSNYSFKSVVLFFTGCLTLLSLFVFFQFSVLQVPFDNAVDFAAHLSKSATFEVSPLMVHIEYFAPFKDSYLGYILPVIASYAVPLGIALLTISLPLLIVFGAVWKSSLYLAESKFLKFIFFLCAFAPLIFVPIAFFLNDWERYLASALNTQFILIFYFIFTKDPVVTACAKRIYCFFERHFLLFCLLIIFACSLKFSEPFTNIFSFIQNKDALSETLEKYVNGVLNNLALNAALWS